MIVYILFHETNTGHSEESDGYIEAVYATREGADEAKLAALRAAIADGQDVYYDPDAEEDFPETWEHDWRVEVHEVRVA